MGIHLFTLSILPVLEVFSFLRLQAFWPGAVCRPSVSHLSSLCLWSAGLAPVVSPATPHGCTNSPLLTLPPLQGTSLWARTTLSSSQAPHGRKETALRFHDLAPLCIRYGGNHTCPDIGISVFPATPPFLYLLMSLPVCSNLEKFSGPKQGSGSMPHYS